MKITREQIVDVWLGVMAAGVTMLLALWIYAAWLDIQPVVKPNAWLDKRRNNICYFVDQAIYCIGKE
jgi:hypothetical protein